MRGRLYHKFFAEFGTIDAQTIREVPTGTDPELASGFDDDFGEVIVFTTPNGAREQARKEETVLIPCNIENEAEEALDQRAAGNSPNSRLVVVVTRKTLDRMNLVNKENGESKIRVNDRLVSIQDKCGTIVRAFVKPPSMYVTESKWIFGISQLPELLLLTCEEREQFTRG
jgi:hypothetical protein